MATAKALCQRNFGVLSVCTNIWRHIGVWVKILWWNILLAPTTKNSFFLYSFTTFRAFPFIWSKKLRFDRAALYNGWNFDHCRTKWAPSFLTTPFFLGFKDLIALRTMKGKTRHGNLLVPFFSLKHAEIKDFKKRRNTLSNHAILPPNECTHHIRGNRNWNEPR